MRNVKKRDKHICYFCDYSVSEINLLIFDEKFGISEEQIKLRKRGNLKIILCKFFDDEITKQIKIGKGNVYYKNLLLNSIKYFLQNNASINIEIRQKYIERIKLCENLKELNPGKYNFKSIKLNGEEFNILKKEYDLIIEKKRRGKRKGKRNRKKKRNGRRRR